MYYTYFVMAKFLFILALCMISASALYADQILYSGTLGEKRFSPLGGSWEIVKQEGGTRFLVLGNDFRSRGGPDLKIFFSRLPLSRIHDNNAANRNYSVRIGELKSTKGTQRYRLPATLDLSVYKTWVVHCEAYAHLWDGAELITEYSDADIIDESVDEPNTEPTEDIYPTP